MSTLLTICIIGFAIVFAELYSIKGIVSKFQSSREQSAEIRSDINRLRIVAEDLFEELKKHNSGINDQHTRYLLHVAKETIEEVKNKHLYH